MPLDPAGEMVLAFLRQSVPITGEVSPAEARATMAAATAALPQLPVHDWAEREIPGPAGPIRVRIYRPNDDTDLPVVVYYHGGGWVVGSLEGYDNIMRALATDASCAVVAVDYRLAPEHRFPAAVDDADAAYRWVRANAASFGGDPSRVAVAGDSAGGTLATVAALLARDAGAPVPTAQVLLYPVIDHELDTPSKRENATGWFLERRSMDWFVSLYAPDPATRADWRFAPLRAPDLAGLPPALVVALEYDPLRDEDVAYADALAAAGVPVELCRCDSTFHGCFGMHDVFPAARPMWDAVLAHLGAAFAREEG